MNPFLINYWHQWPNNFSTNQSVTGIGSFFQYLNNDIGGYLGIIILVAIFGISFMALKNNSSAKAFGTSAFITAFLSVIMMRAGLVPVSIVITLIVIAIIGILMVREDSQRGL